MDLYNLTMKIPYVMLLLTGFTVISIMYVGGLKDIQINIDEYDKEKFRLAVVLENTISVTENTSNFNYERRRTAIPGKFFTNEITNPDNIGYMRDGTDCYIPRVNGLDGENFGFRINSLDSSYSLSTKCRGGLSGGDKEVFAPVMLVRDGKNRVPARLVIYAK